MRCYPQEGVDYRLGDMGRSRLLRQGPLLPNSAKVLSVFLEVGRVLRVAWEREDVRLQETHDTQVAAVVHERMRYGA